MMMAMSGGTCWHSRALALFICHFAECTESWDCGESRKCRHSTAGESAVGRCAMCTNLGTASIVAAVGIPLPPIVQLPLCLEDQLSAPCQVWQLFALRRVCRFHRRRLRCRRLDCRLFQVWAVLPAPSLDTAAGFPAMASTGATPTAVAFTGATPTVMASTGATSTAGKCPTAIALRVPL